MCLCLRPLGSMWPWSDQVAEAKLWMGTCHSAPPSLTLALLPDSQRSIKFTIGLWGLNLAQALSKCRKEAIVVLRWPALPCSVSPFLLLLFCCPLLLGEDFPCQRLCSIPPLFNQAGPFPQFHDIHQSVIKQIFIKRPPSATLYSGGMEMEDR